MHIKWIKIRINLTGPGGRAGDKKDHGLHGGTFGTAHMQITGYYLANNDESGVLKNGDGKDAIVMNNNDDLKRMWPSQISYSITIRRLNSEGNMSEPLTKYCNYKEVKDYINV